MARERPGPRPEPLERRDGDNRTPRESERSDRLLRTARTESDGRGRGEGEGGGRGGRGRGRGPRGSDGEAEGRGDGRNRRPRSSRGRGGKGGEGEGGEGVSAVTKLKPLAASEALAAEAGVISVSGSAVPTTPAVEESSES